MDNHDDFTETDDIKIAGSGSVSGGKYGTVRVAGSGTIEGDLQARIIKTAGSAKCKGDVKAKEIKTAGSCRIQGKVRAGEINTTGTCKIINGLRADLLKVSGSQKIGGGLTGNYCKVTGSLKVKGDVEVDKFVSKGVFTIENLLSADEIEIHLGGTCKVKQIGGEKIEVRRKGTGWSLNGEGLRDGLENIDKKLDKVGEKFGVEVDLDTDKLTREISKLGEKIQVNIGGWGAGTLTTDLVEGDQVYLEWTKANTVRGKKVIIGEGCEIERVEYSSSIQISDDAEVATEVQL